MKNKKQKAIFISGAIVVLALAALAAVYSNRSSLKGSLATVGQQCNPATTSGSGAPGSCAAGLFCNPNRRVCVPGAGAAPPAPAPTPTPQAPRENSLYPVGIAAGEYARLQPIRARQRKEARVGLGDRLLPRSAVTTADHITALPFVQNLQNVAGQTACKAEWGLRESTPSFCVWSALGIEKTVGRYVQLQFDTEGLIVPQTRAIITLKHAARAPRRNTEVNIFSVLKGQPRWHFKGACNLPADREEVLCEINLGPNYFLQEIIVARSSDASGGTPYVHKVEAKYFPESGNSFTLAKNVQGQWAQGQSNGFAQNDDFRIAEIQTIDGKTKTVTVGKTTKCMEDGQLATPLEEWTKGKTEGAVNHVINEIQKTTGENLVGKAAELMAGKKASVKDFGMCDHSARCKKQEDLLKKAGLDPSQKQGPAFGQPAEKGLGRFMDSRRAEGGFGGEGSSDEAAKAAREQIDALRALPGVAKEAREARTTSENLKQARENASRNATEANKNLTDAKKGYKEAQKGGNATATLVAEKRLAHAREEAKGAAAEAKQQNTTHAQDARSKAENNARAAEAKEKDLKNKAAGESSRCPQEDEKCLDADIQKYLQQQVDFMNKFLPANAQIKKGGDLLRQDVVNKLKPSDGLVNPYAPLGDEAQNLGQKAQKKLDACFIMNNNPAVNPGPDYVPRNQCGFDCPSTELAVGKQCEGQGEQPTSGNPVAVCANQNTFPGQQGAIDCPEDNPNCGRFPERREEQDCPGGRRVSEGGVGGGAWGEGTGGGKGTSEAGGGNPCARIENTGR